MKKLTVFFVLFIWSSYGYADMTLASTTYVQRIVDELDSQKQDKLTTDSIVETGSGSVIQSITINDGAINVNRGGSSIAVGSPQSTTVAQLWVD